MSRHRIEAFSDAIMAILATIMVLDLRAPGGHSWDALGEVLPVLFAFGVSFLLLGIYWVNHHHLFSTVGRVNGKILWANLNLMFWLSLVPFVTAWADGDLHAADPAIAYGIVGFLAGEAYFLLSLSTRRAQHASQSLARAIGQDRKGFISPLLWLAGASLALWEPMLSYIAYVAILAMWLVPDRRIEAALE